MARQPVKPPRVVLPQRGWCVPMNEKHGHYFLDGISLCREHVLKAAELDRVRDSDVVLPDMDCRQCVLERARLLDDERG